MKQAVNSAGPKLTNEPLKIRDVVTNKSIITPFFYTETFTAAARGLNFDAKLLNPLAASIIIVDERIEQGTNCAPQDCLQESLKLTGLENLQNSNPLTFAAMQNMQQAMQDEEVFKNAHHLSKYNPEDTIKYNHIAGQSFGLMPLFAFIAETQGEQDSFQESQPLLQAVEHSSRILADIITLGKDLKSNAPNVVTIRTAATSTSTRLALKYLIHEAKTNLTEIREFIKTQTEAGNTIPEHLKFAMNFTEVLENIAGVEDPNIKFKDSMLQLLGKGIQTLVYPTHL